MTRKLVLLVSMGALALGAGVPSAMAKSAALPKARTNAISSHSVNSASKQAITKKVRPTAVVAPRSVLK